MKWFTSTIYEGLSSCIICALFCSCATHKLFDDNNTFLNFNNFDSNIDDDDIEDTLYSCDKLIYFFKIYTTNIFAVIIIVLKLRADRLIRLVQL